MRACGVVRTRQRSRPFPASVPMSSDGRRRSSEREEDSDDEGEDKNDDDNREERAERRERRRRRISPACSPTTPVYAPSREEQAWLDSELDKELHPSAQESGCAPPWVGLGSRSASMEDEEEYVAWMMDTNPHVEADEARWLWRQHAAASMGRSSHN